MSKGAHNVLVLVINVLGSDWKPKHVTLGFFETVEIIGQALVKNLIELLDDMAWEIISQHMWKMRVQI